MRVAILGERMYDADNATFRALSQVPDTRLFACFPRSESDAPLDMAMFSWLEDRYCFTACTSTNPLAHYVDSGDLDEAVLGKKVKDFRPDVFLVSSWHVPVYRRLLRRYPGIPKVVRFDNQWFGTWRQKLGALVAPFYIHKTFDAAFVGGERQAEFARHIGFKERQIWHSAFSCDTDRFNRIYRQREGQAGGYPRSFLFVGLLLPKKGVAPLAEAYRRYRARTQDPWPMTVCGLGPLAELLEGQAGVTMRGFVQPPDMAAIYAQSSCLLAPSTFEPWGYVPHEAAAAGLAVITTTVVGSSVHLVRDGFNGFLIPPEDAESLADAMLRYTSLSDQRRRTMADNSYSLSLQFTPQLWAEHFHTRASDLIARNGRSCAA